ncbi:MAG: DivIVA domain-containing protein [Clostridia bacterium]|nr:DivIVA domain-containing protein [Clostridia bacterium]MDD4386195.1 DivIVA domain-containing protein [Clostridia bacterium]
MIMPIDIENKVFKKSKLGGYEIKEVENFLELLIVDYENLYKENSEIKEKLIRSEESIKYYDSLEQGVTQTIENSQKVADEIKEKAAIEADEIRKSARCESSFTLEEVKLEIRAKQIELEQIKQQMQIYKIKVSSMLEAQLKIIKEEE